MRILITGSRHYLAASKIRDAIKLVSAGVPHAEITIVHGGAPGADMAADYIAKFNKMNVEAHPADWSTGKSAGPKRNQEMVDLGADICLAFPLEDSRGTWDCIKRANQAGIPVMIP